MNLINTGFTDLYVIAYSSFVDNRGEFVKTIHGETFLANGLEYKFTESFYSSSKIDVIRGMHFQFPPHDHEKLVYVVAGKILDVVIDIRKSSETYGKCFSVELSAENHKAVYIGKGFAHGFLTLEENSIVEYHTTTSQNREHEGGIKWDTIGFNWGITNPITSERDNSFDSFDLTKSYFL
jgi:dTDP-4-dehydrorhamnose 3,5-epimerase